MKKRLEELKKTLAVQGQDGNWNYDPYHHGMFNALELAVATMEGREPEYRDAPEKWLCNTEIDPLNVYVKTADAYVRLDKKGINIFDRLE